MPLETSDCKDVLKPKDTKAENVPAKWASNRAKIASIQGRTVPGDKPKLKGDAAIPKWKGPIDYSSVPNPRADAIGPGREFNPDHKVRLREYNREKNGGLLRSDLDGSVLHEPTKGSADNMQAEVDHKIPQNKDGPNTSDNAQILSKGQNRDKSDN